jgi:hypothetical protein
MSPPSAPLAVFTFMMLLAPVTNWEPHGVTLAGYSYAMRHGMKVQNVTPFRVSHLQRYGVTERGNVTSVYLPRGRAVPVTKQGLEYACLTPGVNPRAPSPGEGALSTYRTAAINPISGVGNLRHAFHWHAEWIEIEWLWSHKKWIFNSIEAFDSFIIKLQSNMFRT